MDAHLIESLKFVVPIYERSWGPIKYTVPHTLICGRDPKTNLTVFSATSSEYSQAVGLILWSIGWF
jgi:hypothetical protein